jgi:hypothetical protein
MSCLVGPCLESLTIGNNKYNTHKTCSVRMNVTPLFLALIVGVNGQLFDYEVFSKSQTGSQSIGGRIIFPS